MPLPQEHMPDKCTVVALYSRLLFKFDASSGQGEKQVLVMLSNCKPRNGRLCTLILPKIKVNILRFSL